MSHSASLNTDGGNVGTGLTHPNDDILASGSPSEALQGRTQLLEAMRKGLVCNGLALLVACSGLLSSDDYNRLDNVLWYTCLDNKSPFIQARVCVSSSDIRFSNSNEGRVSAHAKRREG